jgi:hypothetical protein
MIWRRERGDGCRHFVTRETEWGGRRAMSTPSKRKPRLDMTHERAIDLASKGYRVTRFEEAHGEIVKIIYSRQSDRSFTGSKTPIVKGTAKLK